MAAPATAQEQGKLLVWINGDKGYNGLQKIGDQFSKKSGIGVTVEHPEDAPGKFQQAAAAGKGPDIWCWPHDRMGEWAQSGLIVPINPSKKVHDAIEDTAWNAFKFQGKTWPLEVIACYPYPKGQKAHETLVTIDIKPSEELGTRHRRRCGAKAVETIACATVESRLRGLFDFTPARTSRYGFHGQRRIDSWSQIHPQ